MEVNWRPEIAEAIREVVGLDALGVAVPPLALQVALQGDSLASAHEGLAALVAHSHKVSRFQRYMPACADRHKLRRRKGKPPFKFT